MLRSLVGSEMCIRDSFYPDFGYVMQLVQTAYLSFATVYLIAYTVWALGGARKFLQHVTSIAPEPIWQHIPGCCVWGWWKCICKDKPGFCGVATSTPEYRDVMLFIKYLIGQYVLVPPTLGFLLVGIDGFTSATGTTALYVIGCLVWTSMCFGWYGLVTLLSWVGTVDVCYDRDMDQTDVLMIREAYPDSELTALTSSTQNGSGAGSGLDPEDVDVGAKTDSAEPQDVDVGVAPDPQETGDDLQGNNQVNQGSTQQDAKHTTANTKGPGIFGNCELWLDIALSKVFREKEDTFGQQFCLKRKLAFLVCYFFQTVTLTSFLGTFMDKYVVVNGQWVNSIQMSHAWTGFLVIAVSLPLALLAWFAFPVAATFKQREPMRALGNRVITGPNPRRLPPEAEHVFELMRLMITGHEIAYLDGIDVEHDPTIIKDKVLGRNDML
eukprot:TRINITY_DN1189_c0_g1_i4.p1 TRINITY_DN1189_c0_g1~~TRINITY_DN1189_c0_g1_i4.p1  ORF type:complete len:488 (-),score=133.76 TRINITY_DN1189_c0_g1_i4:231-1544(-)